MLQQAAHAEWLPLPSQYQCDFGEDSSDTPKIQPLRSDGSSASASLCDYHQAAIADDRVLDDGATVAETSADLLALTYEKSHWRQPSPVTDLK